MKKWGFFAMLWRMKYINRWGLMRNTRTENLSEHTLDVAYLSHGLGIIGNTRLGKNYDCGRLALGAMYHDCSEILTGDMPTPVKYYNNELRSAFKKIEDTANSRLISLIPSDLCPSMEECFSVSIEEKLIIKCADKLSALIKCLSELNAGNNEFKDAYFSTLKSIKEMKLKEAEIFLDEFLPAYGLTLDELSNLSAQ